MDGKYIALGILIPFVGTSLGSACVYFLKGNKTTGGETPVIPPDIEKGLTGVAAGVMVAASIWSLLIPAMEESSSLGRLAFLPAVIGFWVGTLFLFALDKLIPHLHLHAEKAEGPRSSFQRTTMMLLAVTIHNIPEGMAVGVVYAGMLTGDVGLSLGAALALSIGIAIQNFPEGAIISMPLHANGQNKHKAFVNGVLSGAVEPVAAVLMLLFAPIFSPLMPYFLSFAAGAMIYVVVEELIPETAEGEHSNWGVLLFAVGFTVMMALDVALG